MNLEKWAPALSHRNYRIYFMGQTANWFGTWIQQLALGWWAYRVSGSVGWLAAVGVCSQLPILLFGPWASSLADHVERRRGVMWTQGLSLLQAFALLMLHASGQGGPWTIAACSLFLGIVNTFDIPLRQSFASHMVPPEHLRSAVAINSSCANFCRLAAPALGGVIIAYGGEGACFAINCVSFSAILWALSLLPKQPPVAALVHGVGAIGAFGKAIVHARKDPAMMSGLWMAAMVSLFATPYLSMMPALAKDGFNAGSELYGLAMGASGLGAMISGIFQAVRPAWMGSRGMAILGVIGSAALCAMPWMPTALWALPLLGLVGFGLAGSASAANVMVQSRCDPAMRGRVLGLFAMCLYGGAPLGTAAMGGIANRFGAPMAVSVGGGCALAASILLAMAGSRSKKRRAMAQAFPAPCDALECSPEPIGMPSSTRARKPEVPGRVREGDSVARAHEANP